MIFKVKNKNINISNYFVQYAYHYPSRTLIPSSLLYFSVCYFIDSFWNETPLSMYNSEAQFFKFIKTSLWWIQKIDHSYNLIIHRTFQLEINWGSISIFKLLKFSSNNWQKFLSVTTSVCFELLSNLFESTSEWDHKTSK